MGRNVCDGDKRLQQIVKESINGEKILLILWILKHVCDRRIKPKAGSLILKPLSIIFTSYCQVFFTEYI